MRYLLDTHTFLWMAAEPDQLSDKVKNIVQQGDCELFLSAASGWEVALLTRLKRIELPDEPERFISEAIQRMGIIPVPISFSTAISSAMLPLIHRDPFDRIMIAEAKKEKMVVLTRDSQFKEYGIQTLW